MMAQEIFQAILRDCPGLVPPEQFIQIALPLAPDHLFYLIIEQFFVAGAVRFIKHAEGPGQMSFHPRVVEHAYQDLRLKEILFIVYPAVVFADAIPQLDDDGPEPIETDAFFALRAENERLPLFEKKGLHGFGPFFGEDLKSPVIEDIAVLIDLQEAGAFMCMTAEQHLLKMFGIAVHAPGYETGIGAPGERQHIEGMVDASVGGRFGHLVLFRSGRILSLGQTVDLIIEQQDIDVEIPA